MVTFNYFNFYYVNTHVSRSRVLRITAISNEIRGPLGFVITELLCVCVCACVRVRACVCVCIYILRIYLLIL
jgi:hypothetical protein